MGSWATSDFQSTLAQFLAFAGKPLLVRSNSSEVLRHAASFFTPLDTSSQFPDDSAVLTLIVHDRCDAAHEEAPLFRGSGLFAMARFTSADVVWFNLRARRAFGFISQAVASDERRWHKDILPAVAGILAPVLTVLPVHAACLAKDGHGVLLAASSGTGKSTLAVTLARLGYDFLADEWTYLANDGGELQAWSLPVPIKLLPDAARLFPELSKYECSPSLNGEIAYEVAPQECFSLTRSQQCKVGIVVLLERSTKDRCRITQIHSAAALQRLAEDIEPLTGPLESAYRHQLELLDGMAGAVCLQVEFSAPPREVALALDHAITGSRNRGISCDARLRQNSLSAQRAFETRPTGFTCSPREAPSAARSGE